MRGLGRVVQVNEGSPTIAITIHMYHYQIVE